MTLTSYLPPVYFSSNTSIHIGVFGREMRLILTSTSDEKIIVGPHRTVRFRHFFRNLRMHFVSACMSTDVDLIVWICKKHITKLPLKVST